MTTWRERVAEDRGAGSFSRASQALWCDSDHCPVGEGVARFGFEAFTARWEKAWDAVDGGESGFSYRFLHAMHQNDFDAADSILDAIEDRVLVLKREQAT